MLALDTSQHPFCKPEASVQHALAETLAHPTDNLQQNMDAACAPLDADAVVQHLLNLQPNNLASINLLTCHNLQASHLRQIALVTPGIAAMALCNPSGAALGMLSQFGQLRSLTLALREPVDLRPLANLTGLQNLRFAACRQLDLQAFAPLVNVRELHISNCRGVYNFLHLAAWPSLTRVVLQGSHAFASTARMQLTDLLARPRLARLKSWDFSIDLIDVRGRGGAEVSAALSRALTTLPGDAKVRWTRLFEQQAARGRQPHVGHGRLLRRSLDRAAGVYRNVADRLNLV